MGIWISTVPLRRIVSISAGYSNGAAGVEVNGARLGDGMPGPVGGPAPNLSGLGEQVQILPIQLQMIFQNDLCAAVGGYQIVVPKGVQVFVGASSIGPLKPVAAPIVKCVMRGLGIFDKVRNVLRIERVIAAGHMKRL